MVESQKCNCGRNGWLQVLGGTRLAGIAWQIREDFERLSLQLDSHSALAQLTGAGIEFESPETQDLVSFRTRWGGLWHGSSGSLARALEPGGLEKLCQLSNCQSVLYQERNRAGAGH